MGVTSLLPQWSHHYSLILPDPSICSLHCQPSLPPPHALCPPIPPRFSSPPAAFSVPSYSYLTFPCFASPCSLHSHLCNVRTFPLFVSYSDSPGPLLPDLQTKPSPASNLTLLLLCFTHHATLHHPLPLRYMLVPMTSYTTYIRVYIHPFLHAVPQFAPFSIFPVFPPYTPDHTRPYALYIGLLSALSPHSGTHKSKSIRATLQLLQIFHSLFPNSLPPTHLTSHTYIHTI